MSPSLNRLGDIDARAAARATDQYFHASQARAFASLSPASLNLAWLDWATHLTASPGKQAELLRLAIIHQIDLAHYLYDCLRASGGPSRVCITSLLGAGIDDSSWLMFSPTSGCRAET